MNIVIQLLQEIRPEQDFTTSSDFITDGLLDSFDIVSVVAALEARFGVCIEGRDILPENFSNAQTINSLLRTYGVLI